MSKLYNMDLKKILSIVGNPNGFGYNPSYIERISKPSKYLGDFFGIHILNDNICISDIKEDFDSDDFEIICETSDSIKMKFMNKYTLEIFVNSAISIKGLYVELNLAAFDGESFSEYLDAIDSFHNYLNDRNLEDKYLIKNMFYNNEKTVYQLMNSGKKSIVLNKLSTKSDFENSKNSIVIYHDSVHGDAENIKKLVDVVYATDFDWIAFEMLSHNQQKIMSAFLDEPVESEKYKAALEELVSIYKSAWVLNEKFENPEDNYFIQVFKACKKKGIRVYGMEPDEIRYLLFRNGETEFGGAVRSDIWSTNVPLTGRGIVVGGAAHFSSHKSINFQDLHTIRNPEVKFYSKFTV